MFQGVWEGSHFSDSPRILVLGESHYVKEGESPIDTTSSVVQAYLDCMEAASWGSFFEKIEQSFGYSEEEKEVFWQSVCFGNYVEELCGIRDHKAEDAVKLHRKNYNNALFRYVNEHEIDIVTCFSISVYNSLPAMNDQEERPKSICLGRIGQLQRRNMAYQCIYMPETEHKECEVILKKSLSVYGFRHPSSACGYNVNQVRNVLAGILPGRVQSI